MHKIANLVNFALHPIVLTIPSVFLLTYVATKNFQTSFLWTVFSLVFSGLISLFVVLGVKKGFFNNIDVSNRKQRIILYPFAIGIIILFSLSVVFFDGPKVLADAGIFFIISLAVLDLVNNKIKASVHVACLSAFVTGIVYVWGGPAFLLYLLVPLIAWARIIQKRHTLSETIVGAFLGITLTVVSIYIVQLVV